MRIGVVVDVGQEAFHVGDEAIAVSTIRQLMARGVQPVLFSRSPGQSAAMLPGVETRSALDVPSDPRGRETLLASVDTRSESILRDSPMGSRLRGIDAVLVAGGGNMSSPFPGLLYERLVMLRLAQRFGLPTAVSGQTIGPVLTDPDAANMLAVLSKVNVVGVRDAASRDRLSDLGLSEQTAVAVGIDDATFLDAVDDGADASRSVNRIRIVVSLAPGAWLSADVGIPLLAAELDAVVSRHDASVVLVPHQATPGRSDIDVATLRAVSGAMRTDAVTVLDDVTIEAAVRAVRGADVVISSRFHGLVFSLSSGVPCLGIASDAYGAVRMEGAMAHWGMRDYVVPGLLLRPGDVRSAVAALLEQAPENRRLLAGRAAVLHDFQRAWWDRIVATLSGEDADMPTLSSIPQHRAPSVIETCRVNAQGVYDLSARADTELLLRRRAEAVPPRTDRVAGAVGVVEGPPSQAAFDDELVALKSRLDFLSARERELTDELSLVRRERNVAHDLNDELAALTGDLERRLDEAVRRPLISGE